MELICAGPGDRIHGSRRIGSVLRGQSAGLDFEFLQRIGEGNRQVQAIVRIVDVCAIQIVGDTSGEAARHGDLDRRIVAGGRACCAGSGCRHSRKEDQLRRLTTIQRQFQHALVINDAADAGRLCFN